MTRTILYLTTAVCLMFACQSPAELPEIVLFENGTGDYSCYRIPAILKAPEGSLLAFAEGRTENLVPPRGRARRRAPLAL